MATETFITTHQLFTLIMLVLVLPVIAVSFIFSWNYHTSKNKPTPVNMGETDISPSQYGSGHGTIRSYITGFILSIILTIIPFTLVINHLLSNIFMGIAIAALALMQFFVQIYYFLHLNTSSKARWNLIAFIFAVIVVAILVVGSLWIMYNLNYNMMEH